MQTVTSVQHDIFTFDNHLSSLCDLILALRGKLWDSTNPENGVDFNQMI